MRHNISKNKIQINIKYQNRLFSNLYVWLLSFICYLEFYQPTEAPGSIGSAVVMS